jgi:hypothetical protein
VAVLVYARLHGAPASDRFIEFNRARLVQLGSARSGGKPYTVVLLGSSALKYATIEDRLLAAELERRAKRPVQVFRLVNNWGVFGDFEPLGDSLVELQPDLVLLQSELIAVDRPYSKHLELVRDYLRWPFYEARAWDHRDEDPAEVQFEQPCWNRKHPVYSIREQRRRSQDWVTPDATGPSARAAREFLERIRAAGATVVLLNVPRRDDYEGQLDAERLAALAAADRAIDTVSLESAWGPQPLAKNLYCDVTHLSPEGRRRYSEWLLDRIDDFVPTTL